MNSWNANRYTTGTNGSWKHSLCQGNRSAGCDWMPRYSAITPRNALQKQRHYLAPLYGEPKIAYGAAKVGRLILEVWNIGKRMDFFPWPNSDSGGVQPIERTRSTRCTSGRPAGCWCTQTVSSAQRGLKRKTQHKAMIHSTLFKRTRFTITPIFALSFSGHMQVIFRSESMCVARW